LANRRAIGDWWFMNNKLGLPTGALQRHHRSSGNFRCDLSTKVASYEVKAQIKTCSRASMDVTVALSP